VRPNDFEARLRPFLKSLAILGMAYLRKKADCARHLSYTVVYHKFFENKRECDPYTAQKQLA